MSGRKDYVILEGWFEDTVPKFSPGPVAQLRLDEGWYESTRCALENLAPRLVPGGFIIVDDHHDWEDCAVAVNVFAARQKWKIRQNHHGVCCVSI